MPVTLPNCPPPSTFEIELVRSVIDLRPAFGGPVQRIERLGSRWRAVLSFETMTSEQSRAWSDVDVEADTVRWAVPQLEFAVGSPGSSVQVDGSGQTGNVLKLKGLPAAYEARKGQWFSVITGGVSYLYRVRADATASGAGLAEVPVQPLIRAAHLNNDAVNVAAPIIEGFVVGPSRAQAWRRKVVPEMSFVIEERA